MEARIGSGVDERREALRRAWKVFPGCGFLFLLLAIFVAADLAADLEAGMSALHIGLESIALGVALVGVGATGWQLYSALRRADELHVDLQRTRADVERWRAEAEGLLRRYGVALDDQFGHWGLSEAEREIAVPILKGLSYKEIASARGTTERTVRHQALGIFRKAGVSGRAEMAAYFLEAMLLPVRAAEARDAERAPTPVPSGAARN